MDPMVVVGTLFAVVALVVLVSANRRHVRGADGGGMVDGSSVGNHCDSGSDAGGCDGGGGGD